MIDIIKATQSYGVKATLHRQWTVDSSAQDWNLFILSVSTCSENVKYGTWHHEVLVSHTGPVYTTLTPAPSQTHALPTIAAPDQAKSGFYYTFFLLLRDTSDGELHRHSVSPGFFTKKRLLPCWRVRDKRLFSFINGILNLNDLLRHLPHGICAAPWCGVTSNLQRSYG